MTYYINGKFLPQSKALLGVDDIGLLRGYGIFDFFKSINGNAIFIEDHLTRFEHSAQRMHLTIPQTRDQLRAIILELIKRNPQPTLGIKMILTGGYAQDGYSPTTPNLILLAKPFTSIYPAIPQKLMTCHHQRELHDIKTTNYLTPILNIPRMQALGADDILYFNDESILESSRSNIFIVKGQTLITPKDNILYGISRKHIINRASHLFPVQERRITLAELFTADEVFISSSTKRVVPITHIDDHTFSNNATGPITTQISELMKDV